MELDLWPEAARVSLSSFLKRASGLSERPYAVFDADNTLWEHDLEEALVSFLEAQGRIGIDSLSPSIRPVEPLLGESLFGYYDRLCGLDIHIGYMWVLQVFCGFTLGEMQSAIDEMLALNQPHSVAVMQDGELVSRTVAPPRVFGAQIQLVRALEEAGVDVWIVSAASEDLCRMVASDPKYLLNVRHEQVVGANLLLRRADGSFTTSADVRAAGVSGASGFWSPERMDLTLTHHLRTPATWYEGKVAGIKTWIDPIQRPIFVAGDAASDFAMLFYCDADAGGLRLRVDKKPKYREMWLAERELRRATPSPRESDPDLGWVEVTPEALR